MIESTRKPLETIKVQLKASENNPQIKVGINPYDIAVNKITNKIYVTNLNSGTVSVIDSNSGKAAKNIRVGEEPSSIAVDSDHNKIYVSNRGSNTVSVIDGNNDTVIGTIPVGIKPVFIAIDSLLHKIYVANRGNNTVSVIDVPQDKKEPQDIPVGSEPVFIAIDSSMFKNYSRIYVANNFSGVSAIDGYTSTEIGQISVGSNPVYIAVDSPHDKIYVANSGNNTVSVINEISNRKELPDIPIGNPPISYATDSLSIAVESSFDSSYDKIYVTNSNSYISNADHTVNVIDGKTDKIEQISAAKSVPGPTDIELGFAPAGTKIYVTNSGNNTVSVINGTNDKMEPHDIPVGKHPSHMAVNTNTGIIYVVNEFSDSVSVIDGSTDRVAAGVTFNTHPENSGTIICNSKEYPTNIYLYVDAGTTCTVNPNKDFQFIGWAESLNQNSTIPLGDSSGNLTVNRYGTFTANFKPIPPPIPPEFWLLLIGIILSSVIGWSIPSVTGKIKTRTERKYLKECMNQIGISNKKAVEDKVTGYYVDGKINEYHHQLLKDKISEYYDNSNTSKRSPI